MRKNLFLCGLLLCFLLALVGCGKETAEQTQDAGTITVTDSIGREVTVPHPLTRVVVSNAYNAELINAVGAIDTVVGVDNYIFNDEAGFKGKFKQDQVIGANQGNLNYEKIIELQPQALILTGNGGWEDAEEKLSKFGIAVIVVDAYYTREFQDNCTLIGKLFGKEAEAAELSDFFTEKLDYIKRQTADVPKKDLYFEYRTEGKTTVPGDYFFDMVEYSGAHNIFDDAKNVQVNPEAVIERNPAYIVKVSEPKVNSSYIPPTPEDEARIMSELKSREGWDTIDAVKNDRILLLSHYVHGGASKLVGTMYIAKFLYPEQLPDLHPEDVFKVWLEKYQHLPYVAGHTYPAFPLSGE